MNPNDINNQNNNQPVVPSNQAPVDETKVDSIAKIDEVPMSISPLVQESAVNQQPAMPQPEINSEVQKVEIPQPVVETSPVESTSMFNQNNLVVEGSHNPEPVQNLEVKPATDSIIPEAPAAITVTSTPMETTTTESKDSLLNFQTNSINPNTNININDFRIAGEDKKEELAMPQTPSSVDTSSQPAVQINTPANNNNHTAILAVAGVVVFGLLVGGAFFFISRNNSTKTDQTVGGTYKTEKIAVVENKEIKELTEEEYKTIIKSYIERYNKNIENSKLRLTQPNLTQAQQASIFMDYSTEVLDIYTGIQNLKVPTKFKDQHEKLTLSLYALNSLFDTIVKTLKEGSSNTPINTTLATISKAESVASASFNEIVNSK